MIRKLISFIQRNFSLLDNSGIRPSWFGAMRRFMPDSFNHSLMEVIKFHFELKDADGKQE